MSELKTVERGQGWRAKKGPVAENKSGFRASGHRVLLLGPQPIKKTDSGILLMEKTAQAEMNHSVVATVIEIGYDAWADKSTDFCAVGDKVLVGQYTGKFHDSAVDGKVYRFVQDLDIISTVEDVVSEG